MVWRFKLTSRSIFVSLLFIIPLISGLVFFHDSQVAQAQAQESLRFRPQVGLPDTDTEFGLKSGQETVVGRYDKGYMNSDLLARYIKAIYDYSLTIVGIIAAIVLMGGGLLWLTSAGNDTRIAQAKELIIGSVSGLGILLCAWILLNTINPNLLNMKIISMQVIDKSKLDALLICEWTCMNIGDKCEGGGGHSTITSTSQWSTHPMDTCQLLLGPQSTGPLDNSNKCPAGQDHNCCCRRKYTSPEDEKTAEAILACTENNGKPSKATSACSLNNVNGYCQTIENSGGLTKCVPCIAKGEECDNNTSGDYKCANSAGVCGQGSGGDCNSRPTDGNFAQDFLSFLAASTVTCNEVNTIAPFCPWPFGCLFSGGNVYIECKCE